MLPSSSASYMCIQILALKNRQAASCRIKHIKYRVLLPWTDPSDKILRLFSAYTHASSDWFGERVCDSVFTVTALRSIAAEQLERNKSLSSTALSYWKGHKIIPMSPHNFCFPFNAQFVLYLLNDIPYSFISVQSSSSVAILFNEIKTCIFYILLSSD